MSHRRLHKTFMSEYKHHIVQQKNYCFQYVYEIIVECTVFKFMDFFSHIRTTFYTFFVNILYFQLTKILENLKQK